MTKHKVWITLATEPLRNIREVECEIVVCKKTSWAILPTGRRTLLGTGAFYTRKSAEKMKLGRLRKIEADQYQRRLPQLAARWDYAHHQIQEFNATGTVH